MILLAVILSILACLLFSPVWTAPVSSRQSFGNCATPKIVILFHERVKKLRAERHSEV